MFRRLAVSALLLSSWLNAQAPRTTAQPAFGAKRQAELVAAREAIWRAWFAYDTAQLRKLIPGALAAGQDDHFQESAAVLNESKEFAASGAKLVTLTFKNTRVSSHGAVSVMHSDYEYATTLAGKTTTNRGKATEVFVWQDGRWVNPFWHLDERP